MPQQQPRAATSKNPTRPIRTSAAAATSTLAAPAADTNLLDRLRNEDSDDSTNRVRDLVPIPLMIAVFAMVWALTIYLMGAKWTDDFWLLMSRRAAERGDYVAAISWMEPVVQKYPQNTTGLSELALSHFGLGHYKQALDGFQAAQAFEDAQRAPETDDGKPLPHADFHTMIGRCLIKLGNTTDAEAALLMALKANRLDQSANFALGELEFNRKNYRKAGDYFKVVASTPGYAEKVKEYYEQIEKEMFAGIQ